MTARQVAVMRQQVQGFVEGFAAELGHRESRRWCGKYLELGSSHHRQGRDRQPLRRIRGGGVFD
jgi:hypothetical protein